MPARSEESMARSSIVTRLSTAAVFVSAALTGSAGLSGVCSAAEAKADVVLDNARVRIVRTSAPPSAGSPAVVVPLEDGAGRKKGEAWWSADAKDGAGAGGACVVVEPKPGAAQPPAAPVDGGSKPGDQTFKGISFVPLFENDRVVVLRARMEVGAEEAFHTHARDVVVVHLSGGAIEDTADGKTKVNRWKPGDVEFEARGSSHSARNVGGVIDVVLVTPKP
jgi:quercetin dioxygenase-like cupin family protein